MCSSRKKCKSVYGSGDSMCIDGAVVCRCVVLINEMLKNVHVRFFFLGNGIRVLSMCVQGISCYNSFLPHYLPLYMKFFKWVVGVCVHRDGNNINDEESIQRIYLSAFVCFYTLTYVHTYAEKNCIKTGKKLLFHVFVVVSHIQHSDCLYEATWLLVHE